jgi:hypothetical protein
VKRQIIEISGNVVRSTTIQQPRRSAGYIAGRSAGFIASCKMNLWLPRVGTVVALGNNCLLRDKPE